MYQEFVEKKSSRNHVSVLVAPRDTSLSQIKAAIQISETSVVEDHSALDMLTTEILDDSKFKKIKEKTRQLIKNLPLEASYQAPTGEKYAAGLYPHFSPKSSSLPAAYIVYENDISPAQLSALISPLSICAEELRPKVIFRPLTSAAGLERKLGPIRDKVDLFEAGPFGLTSRDFLTGKGQSYSESEALELYLNFGFDGFSKLSFDDDMKDLDPSTAIGTFYKAMFLINATIRSSGRSAAEQNTWKLISFVERLKDGGSQVSDDELLRMKAFTNILHGFVFEKSSNEIKNTMAIGHSLGDEFLIAMGECLINLVEGVNPSTIQWLQSAENRFRKLGEPVQATYSKHNRLITMLSTNEHLDILEFSDHANQLCEMAPYCERMSSVRQGAAIANLMNDRVTQAHSLYTLSLTDAGSWLQLAEAKVGRLICEYLLGDLVQSEIDKCIRGIVANIGNSKVTYHHKRLAYNLLRLTEAIGGTSVSMPSFLEAGVLNINEINSLNLLFTEIAGKMPVSAPNGALVGARGAFFDRTRLAPGCGFIWH